MELQDTITQSVAEAVKQVTHTAKDFKPHMMYDPKTGKGYEAKTHEDHLKMKDMGYTHEKPTSQEESNEFTAAAAKAKLAGDDEFEFDGKTYPTEISQDAAEKILGKKEEVELEEASTDLEEALKPDDFVKGGDAKITKREVDKMLSKIFVNAKMAKTVENNGAYKAGLKDAGKKKNPYAKDTADFHLYVLGVQSADLS